MSDIVVIAQNAGGNGRGPGCCSCLFWLFVVFIIMAALGGGLGR